MILPIINTFFVRACNILSKRQVHKTSIADAARIRAEARAKERMWADTEIENDPWEGRLNLDSKCFKEYDDRYDGRGALTDEQKRTINALLAGVDVTYVDIVDKDNYVFSKSNQVETIDAWGAVTR